MKKIFITETQLKNIADMLLSEQSQTTLFGVPVTLNLSGGDPNSNPKFGTLNFNINGKSITIRISTDRFGSVNIVDLKHHKKGIYIKTFKGREEILNNNVVKKLIDYVKNPNEHKEIKLDSSILAGDLKAKKV